MDKPGFGSAIHRRSFLERAASTIGCMVAGTGPVFSAKRSSSLPVTHLPDWIRNGRMFVLDGHQFNTAENHIDVREVCRTIADLGGTILRMTAHTYMDYVYYDSQFDCLKAPGLGTDDWFTTARHECERLGIKVIAYFDAEGYLPDSPHYGKYDVKNENGQPVGWYTGHWRAACLNWPRWYELNLSMMREVVQKYSVDAVYLDEDYYVTCYCEKCQQRFKKEAGIPIPGSATLARNAVSFDLPGFDEPKLDIPDRDARRYAEWRSKLCVDLAGSIFETVRSLNPGVLTLFHQHPEERALPHYAGTLSEGGERNRPDWTWRTGYLANSSRIYPIPVYIDMYNNTGVSRKEYKLKCAQVFSNGCYPAVIPVPFFDDRPLAGAGEVFRIAGKYRQYFDFQLLHPVRFLALPRSSMGGELIRDRLVRMEYPIGVDGKLGARGGTVDTHNSKRGWPGTEESRFESPRTGAYGALTLSGILVSNLSPELPEAFRRDLSNYSVLCLANQAAMSDAEIDLVRSFVERGGGLIATHETSLYRNDGSKRRDFGLSDVFGVHYAATDRYIGVVGGYRVHLKVTAPHPVNENLPLGLRVRNCDLILPVKTSGAQPIVSIVQPHGTYYSDSPGGFVGTLRDSLMDGTEIGPAVTVNQFGRGRVIYFAGRPGSMYLHWAIPEMRIWLANAVNWVSRGDVSVRVHAEAPVSIGLFRQQKRHILHVVNMSEAATPVSAVPILRNTMLLVKLAPGAMVRRVWALFCGLDLDHEKKGDGLTITLPELREYEVIAIEHA